MTIKRVIPIMLLVLAVYTVARSIGDSLLLSYVWALVGGVLVMQAAVALRGED